MSNNKEYVTRGYQRFFGWELRYFRVKLEQSQLMIGAHRPMREEALKALREARGQVEEEIAKNPAFASALVPLGVPPGAPEVALWMYRAAEAAGVGPMAAVAGAIARYVGGSLSSPGGVVVENGGDLYMDSPQARVVAIFAGESPLSMKVGVEVPPGQWGVCTSAGRVGHSLSFGHADAALVLARDAALADAAATALGNLLKAPQDVKRAVMRVCAIPGVHGAVAIMGDKLAAAGEIRLVATKGEEYARKAGD